MEAAGAQLDCRTTTQRVPADCRLPTTPLLPGMRRSLRSGSPVHSVAMPALLELAGDVSGLAVCDFACGTGIAARALAAAGARVTGIDLSAALLEIACEESDSVADGVCFIQGDVQRLAWIPGRRFRWRGLQPGADGH